MAVSGSNAYNDFDPNLSSDFPKNENENQSRCQSEKSTGEQPPPEWGK